MTDGTNNTATLTAESKIAFEPKISLDKSRLDKRTLFIWKLHTISLLFVPLAGLVAALGLAMINGINGFDIGLFFLMYSLSTIGITVGYHRYFSHRSFKANKSITLLFGILGSMSAQGPLYYWVSNHRRHHSYSDAPGDPHSPYYYQQQPLTKTQGFWHAHLGWLFHPELTNTLLFTKDLLKDPLCQTINRYYLLWVSLGLIFPTLVGALYNDLLGAINGFLWGGLVRIFVNYHMASSINSICHLWGKKAFNTQEHSVNNHWLVLPTGGEAWHNNHHAFPTSANFGLQKWQFDPGFQVISLFNHLGWIWDIKLPYPKKIKE